MEAIAQPNPRHLSPRALAQGAYTGKAARLRVSAVERLLKQHRIRRVNAEVILRTLRQPAIKVSDGVATAAGIHIHSLILRL